MRWIGRERSRGVRIAILVSLLLAATMWSFAPEAGATVTVTTRFTVVPATVTTPNSPVELRLAISNPGTSAAALDVAFSRTAGSTTTTVATTSVTVPAGATKLASGWWTPGSTVATGAGTMDYVVRDAGTPLASGSWPLTIEAASTRAPARATAAWVEPGHVLSDPSVGEADVRRLVDEMHGLGMDTVIVAYVEYEWNNGWGPFYPSSIAELGDSAASFDVIGTLLDQASANGQRVFLGLGRGPGGPLPLDDGTSTVSEQDAVAAFGERVANELWDLYRDESSFYGWYISHETNHFPNAKHFYDEQARRLHAISPDMPVMVAPAGTPYGLNRAYLDASEVDIFNYQDAVGPGYVGPDASCQPRCQPYTYSYDPYNRIPDLDAIFGRYASWHAGSKKHIWSDTEVWQMSGPTYSLPYAAPCRRLADQLAPEIAHVSQVTAYEYFGYFKSPQDTTRMQTGYARQMYDGYKAFVDGTTSTVCPDGSGQMHACSLGEDLVLQATVRCRPDAASLHREAGPTQADHCQQAFTITSGYAYSQTDPPAALTGPSTYPFPSCAVSQPAYDTRRILPGATAVLPGFIADFGPTVPTISVYLTGMGFVDRRVDMKRSDVASGAIYSAEYWLTIPSGAALIGSSITARVVMPDGSSFPSTWRTVT